MTHSTFPSELIRPHPESCSITQWSTTGSKPFQGSLAAIIQPWADGWIDARVDGRMRWEKQSRFKTSERKMKLMVEVKVSAWMTIFQSSLFPDLNWSCNSASFNVCTLRYKRYQVWNEYATLSCFLILITLFRKFSSFAPYRVSNTPPWSYLITSWSSPITQRLANEQGMTINRN